MKILWAINPFDENSDLEKMAKMLLRKLFYPDDFLEAIYIASSSEMKLVTSFHIPIELRYIDYPRKIIEKKLKKLNLQNIKTNVFFEKSLSLTSLVERVTEYSKEANVDVILLATNSKKTLPKIIFGSFAESLIHMSTCDLLIYHQKSKLVFLSPLNILYSHDLTPKGHAGFEKIIQYAKKWNAHLTIVHVLIPNFGLDLDEFESVAKQRFKEIDELLQEQNIGHTMILKHGVYQVSEVILNLSKKPGLSLVSVTAQADKLTTLLGGSVTRQILRKSPLPILILKV